MEGVLIVPEYIPPFFDEDEDDEGEWNEESDDVEWDCPDGRH